MSPQLTQGLIDSKPGIIGRQFEKHSARLPEIKRVEIIPVDLWGNIQSLAKYLFPELHLHSFVRHPESHVVICASTTMSACFGGGFDKVDDRSRRKGIGHVAIRFPFLLFQL